MMLSISLVHNLWSICANPSQFKSAIVNMAEDRLNETEAWNVGRALSGLAVTLDDAIEDEERKLFPTIQKALFAIGRRD